MLWLSSLAGPRSACLVGRRIPSDHLSRRMKICACELPAKDNSRTRRIAGKWQKEVGSSVIYRRGKMPRRTKKSRKLGRATDIGIKLQLGTPAQGQSEAAI